MRWLLYTGIGSVFLLGGVAGGMLGVTSEREKLKKIEREPTGVMELMGRKLEKELQLDPAQAREVRAIYAEVRPELHRMERERRTRLREIIESTNPRVSAVLRPEQKERFDELHRNLNNRLRLRETGGRNNPGKAKGEGADKPRRERPKRAAETPQARETPELAPEPAEADGKRNP